VTDAQIDVARRYVDALITHDGESVPFAPDAVRHEMGIKTGRSGRHLRRSLSRGPQYRVILGIRDFTANVHNDVVHTEYLLDAGLFGRRLTTVKIVEDFTIPAEDLLIHRVVARIGRPPRS
jgi:hypothetical protein